MVLLSVCKCQSLANKTDELESIVAERGSDVISLTEGWMKEAYSINVYYPALIEMLIKWKAL